MALFLKTEKYYQEYLNNLDIFKRRGELPDFIEIDEEPKHLIYFKYTQNWLEKTYRKKLFRVFSEEYNLALKSSKYFWGSNYNEFKNEFYNRTKQYSLDLPDGSIINYLDLFLIETNGIAPLYFYFIFENETEYQNTTIYTRIKTTANKKIELIKATLKEHGYELLIDKNHEMTFSRIEEKTEIDILEYEVKPYKSNLKWNASQTDLMELIKALIEANAIKEAKVKGKQKELTEELCNLFNVKINNPNKLISDFNTRNTGKETKFLDNLREHLMKFIIK